MYFNSQYIRNQKRPHLGSCHGRVCFTKRARCGNQLNPFLRLKEKKGMWERENNTSVCHSNAGHSWKNSDNYVWEWSFSFYSKKKLTVGCHKEWGDGPLDWFCSWYKYLKKVRLGSHMDLWKTWSISPDQYSRLWGPPNHYSNRTMHGGSCHFCVCSSTSLYSSGESIPEKNHVHNNLLFAFVWTIETWKCVYVRPTCMHDEINGWKMVWCKLGNGLNIKMKSDLRPIF